MSTILFHPNLNYSAKIYMESMDQLCAYIENDYYLDKLLNTVAPMLSSDPAHDLSHSMRVAFWIHKIENDSIPLRDIIAAALCHDIVNLPKDSPNRREASVLSARKAIELLPEFGFSETAIESIAEAIQNHSFSRGAIPTTILGKALQDADRLDALGAIGIMRNVCVGVKIGANLFDIHDPWAQNRKLDDRHFSIDHFFVKLFNLPKTMCTQAGRLEAERRIKMMHFFLEELACEIGVPLPT